MGEASGKFSQLIESSGVFEQTFYVSAGKFRRYHGESLLTKLLDIKTFALNLRDFFRTIRGYRQARRIIKKLQPEVLFSKGGYASVPAGLAAARIKVPIITHDSDAIPGLAHKLIARWTALHATGMPVEFYDYPKDKTVFVGVPIAEQFKPATPDDVKRAKLELGIKESDKILFITGGSQGSQRINDAIRVIAPALLEKNQTLHILHHVGKGNEGLYKTFSHQRLMISPFFDNFPTVATAADIIVTRAGANSMTEFGVLGKPIIVIPSPFLANGHQLENAKQLARLGAIIELDEADVMQKPEQLQAAVDMLLMDKQKRMRIAAELQKVTKSDAATQLAQLIISQGDQRE